MCKAKRQRVIGLKLISLVLPTLSLVVGTLSSTKFHKEVSIAFTRRGTTDDIISSDF